MRVGVFRSRGRVESDSLGSGVSICSWNTRVGVVQSKSRVECGVRARGGVGVAFCLKNMRVGALQSQLSG